MFPPWLFTITKFVGAENIFPRSNKRHIQATLLVNIGGIQRLIEVINNQYTSLVNNKIIIIINIYIAPILFRAKLFTMLQKDLDKK